MKAMYLIFWLWSAPPSIAWLGVQGQEVVSLCSEVVAMTTRGLSLEWVPCSSHNSPQNTLSATLIGSIWTSQTFENQT